MTLTSEQKQLVRSTWEMVVAIQDDAARLFYARLFKIDPSTRALFASADMAEQGKKFIKTITTIVAEVEYPDILRPGIEALGRRHVGYGTKEEHYESVGAALLWTLGRVLGEEGAHARGRRSVGRDLRDASEHDEGHRDGVPTAGGGIGTGLPLRCLLGN